MALLTAEPVIRPDDTTVIPSKDELLRMQESLNRMENRTETPELRFAEVVKLTELLERSNTSTSPPTVVRKLDVPKYEGFVPYEKGVVISGIILGAVGIGLGILLAQPIIWIFSLGVVTLLAIHGLAIVAGE